MFIFLFFGINVKLKEVASLWVTPALKLKAPGFGLFFMYCFIEFWPLNHMLFNRLGFRCSHCFNNNFVVIIYNWADFGSIVIIRIIAFWLDTMRVEKLKEFCDFAVVQYRDILSHAKTRWLLLSPAIDRIILMFDGLKSYFLSQDSSPKILVDFFQNVTALLYMKFIQSMLNIFNHNNIIFNYNNIKSQIFITFSYTI